MAQTIETTTAERTILVAGRERRYLVTKPSAPNSAAPLVLVLHGSNQTPQIIRGFTEPSFDTLASSDGAVVVYPEGYKKHWNDARLSTNFAARTEGFDDVAFLRAIIDEFVSAGTVDATRVFAVGYSLGGQMVNRLAHEVPEILAGIAIISATQPAAENFKPDKDTVHPMPVLLIHGTKDPNVPYEGGMASLLGFRPRGLGLSAPATAKYWAERNGMHSEGATVVIAVDGGRGTTVDRTDFAAGGSPLGNAVHYPRRRPRDPRPQSGPPNNGPHIERNPRGRRDRALLRTSSLTHPDATSMRSGSRLKRPFT